MEPEDPQVTDILEPWRLYDNLLKILIIGDSAVGKTAFLTRFTDDVFNSAFCSTIGIDFRIKTVVKDGRKIKLQIWDTAGQERYRTITSAYYRGTSGFILMYDISNERSFNDINGWCSQVKSFCYENTKAILVGNKCDLTEDRVVTYDNGRDLADEIQLPFFEASAKDNINVKAVFDYLVDIILEEELPSRSDYLAGEKVSLEADEIDLGKREKARAGCRC